MTDMTTREYAVLQAVEGVSHGLSGASLRPDVQRLASSLTDRGFLSFRNGRFRLTDTGRAALAAAPQQ